MANLLASAAGVLASTLLKHASTRVTYIRGEEAIEIDAVKGSSPALIDTGDHGQIELRVSDWIIDPKVLVLGGVRTEPARGDRIEQNDCGRRFIYTLLPNTGEPPWRWSDPHFKSMRIHTKLTEEREVA